MLALSRLIKYSCSNPFCRYSRYPLLLVGIIGVIELALLL